MQTLFVTEVNTNCAKPGGESTIVLRISKTLKCCIIVYLLQNSFSSQQKQSEHFVLSFKDLNWIRVLVSSFQVFPPKPLETLLTWMKGGVTSIINNFDSNYLILLVLVSQTISLLLFGKFRSMIINSESSHCQNDQELSSFWLFR